MARPRKRPLPEEEFQMAPMIDMVFLLLVFFMCVSTLAQADKTTPVDLPLSGESKVPEDLSNRGTVSIDKDGVIHVGAQPVELAEMKRRIGDALRDKPELRVLVRADQETSYGNIRRVLQACAEAGAYEIIYATYQER